jgi:hypothetical protein
MRIDNHPRNQVLPEVNAGQSKVDTKITGAINPTTEQIFSVSHLPATNKINTINQQPTETVKVQAHNGTGLFDRVVFTKPFETAYLAANDAIKNPENQEHMARTGQYSPAAKIAVDKFASIVAGKSADSKTADAARTAFLEGSLSAAEKDAWMQFIAQLPDSYTSQVVPAAAWSQVSLQEIHTALAKEPAFAMLLDKPEGKAFVKQLTDTINKKTDEMSFTDRGMALSFRFASTYNNVAHTACASIWRDHTGALKMVIAHQESVVPTKANGNIHTGVVHDTFDTSSTYPTGVAPVVEAMKLTGMPTVNVFPCPRPEAIEPVLASISGHENAHPYGSGLWHGNKGTLPKDRPFETCFNVTHKILAEMFDAKASYEPAIPTIINKLSPFLSIAPGEFDTVPILKDGKQIAFESKNIDVGSHDNEHFVKIKAPVFSYIGPKWGLSSPWDVGTPPKTMFKSFELIPGQKGIALPGTESKVKFNANTNKIDFLRLDDQPIISGKTYTADEAARMIYTGEKKSKVSAIISAANMAAL